MSCLLGARLVIMPPRKHWTRRRRGNRTPYLKRQGSCHTDSTKCSHQTPPRCPCPHSALPPARKLVLLRSKLSAVAVVVAMPQRWLELKPIRAALPSTKGMAFHIQLFFHTNSCSYKSITSPSRRPRRRPNPLLTALPSQTFPRSLPPNPAPENPLIPTL
ncbi:hypothetical protein GQ43DRAFT_102119 [Delitschia confertaspora ATCC 74209]|uniref:Uncharacterized protein n=1 Tax=Delitschia confertaspora ATCC 74209 TaxID=1513339 RepID=A0A9P4JSE8_9PLEO|nr:hypothetical protein GQ43DRAFT_102119 [Delitschia confertaspora ATCC 74209]